MNVRKVAIVHDWLTGMRGGEKVLEALIEIFPACHIYTLVYMPDKISNKIKSRPIITSDLQKMPFVKSKYRTFLPFMPAQIESFNLKEYDLIISSSHCVAKGAIPHPGQIHISYVFSPMRYIWDQFWNYFSREKVGFVKSKIAKYISTYLRTWDIASLNRVDHFIAISEFVKSRIKRFYNRDASVIYPPVDIGKYRFDAKMEKQDFYLIVSALVPYKKIDIAIELFNRNGEKLKIIGTGPEYKKLKRMAKGNIQFLKYIPDSEIKMYYKKARAFIFPGTEDFGMTMVESIASGTPVVAYHRGGATEIIKEGVSGVFFEQQTPEALACGIAKLGKYKFTSEEMFESIKIFSKDNFKINFIKFLNSIEIEL
jgi:glycosyltransferase involved in cell wall biosynthesis